MRKKLSFVLIFLPLLVLGVIQSQAQLTVVAHESFGDQSYDTDYPEMRPTGWDHHWKWTDVTTFTSTNGMITAGSDSSVRIISYDENWEQKYPGATPIHKALLVNRTAYKGSWDTLYYGGIDISKAKITSIEFGFVMARWLIHTQDTAVLNVQYRVDSGAWVQLDTSLISFDTLDWTKWQFIELPVPSVEGNWLDIGFYGLTEEQVYVDDIRVIGLMKPMAITTETFGDQSYDTDYPEMRPTGWDHHWKWTDVTTFTSTNGHITAGSDSSVRIISYDENWAQDYPGASPIHKALLVNREAYKGSWDTLYYGGIDISGYVLNSIDFGFVMARWLISKQDTAVLNVQYRIDSGAWVQLDTSLISFDTLDWTKWQHISLPVADEEGQWLDIGFYGLTQEQVYVDDITPVGTPKPAGIAKETFGNQSYDTDYPEMRPTGWDHHYKWTDVTTFTSTNGYITAGSDSSVRIISYDENWSQDYPGATPIHKCLLVNREAYKGSWDTLVYQDIDITDSWVTGVEFGFVMARWLISKQDTAVLNVQYRIDKGDWVQMDTSLISFDTLDWTKWQHIQMPLPELRGNTLDLMFMGLTQEQVYVDDITVMGWAPLFMGVMVDSIKVTGEGDATTIDVKGGTLQMYATLYPMDPKPTDTTFTWLASPPDVATIDENGLLTAVGDGVATVTARANDAGRAEGTIEITITNQVPVESIIVLGAGGKTTIDVKGGTLQMVAEPLPANASDKEVSWSVDKPGIGTISETGLLTAVANGVVRVTATAEDGSGVTGFVDITISNQTSSVEDLSSSGMRLFPNPAGRNLYLSNAGSVRSIDVVNLDGRLMLIQKNQGDLVTIDVSGFDDGVYMLRAYTDNGIYITKFFKLK